MADITSVDLARRVGENLEQTSPDLLRAERATGIEPALPAWKVASAPRQTTALCGCDQAM